MPFRIMPSILACVLAGTIHAADFLPLEMGNFWVYRDQRTSQTFTIRAGQPVYGAGGERYHYLTGYTPSPVIARITETGDLVTLDPGTGRETVLSALSKAGGDWWNAPARECPQQGYTPERRVAHESAVGAWPGALEVQYRSFACADAGVVAERFAENIGMLRRVVHTLAGPSVFDLVYARVGHQILETGLRGRFSAAVERVSAQGLTLNLRLDIGHTPAVRLRFDTAQEFDVALRDRAGNVLWKWSDGQVFAAGAAWREIGNAWNQSVIVPLPPGDSTGYLLEAWLTTAPGEARFAAALPVPPLDVIR